MKFDNRAVKIFFEKHNIRDILYSLITVVAFAAMGMVFIWATLFLTREINAVVEKDLGGEGGTVDFDLETFSLVAARLRIPFVLSRPAAAPAEPQNPVPAASPAPAEPPAPEINFSLLSVRVLNGTTIPGLAKLWKDRLEEGGFAVKETGNAAARDYQGMTIEYKPTAASAISRIKEIAAKNTLTVTKEEVVEGTSDITVIIGQ